MQTASPAALDAFIAKFIAQIGGGFGLIQGDVRATFASLIVISLTLTALLWALDENQNVPAALVRKVLLFGFFAWLIGSWHAITLTVIKGFTALGLKAGGGRMSVADLLNSPSKIVLDGLEVAFALLKYIGRLSSEGMGVGFFIHIDTILVTAIVIIGVILAFVLLGVEVVVTVIEFYVVTLIAFVMVPFGILTQTSFLAERAIAYVPAIGAKLMALALIISIGEQIFTSYTVSTEPTWQESCGLLVAAIVFLMLALKIPAIAAAQTSGSPQLSAGSAASSVVGLAATAGGIALAGRWAAGGMAAGTGATSARGAAGLRGAQMSGAARASDGAAPQGPSGPGGSSGGGQSGASGGGPEDGSSGAAEPAAPKPSEPPVSEVVARAKATYPSPAAPGKATSGGKPSPRVSAGGFAAARPWRDDAEGRPAGVPQIHPPSDPD